MDDRATINRRDFLKALSVGAAVTLLPIACSREKSAEMSETGAAPAMRVQTRSDPGAWGGKEDSHVPEAVLTKLDDAGNYRVDVTVQHGMAENHWIQFISLKDNADSELAKTTLQPTAPSASASFTANVTNITGFKVYELCNLHGLWMAEYAVPTA